MSSFRFLPCYRLRKQSEYRRVYDRRRSASDESLIIYACENGLPHLRIGMSVSRKQGPAVHRNRLRRLIREAFRLTRPELPAGLDLVIIPRKTDDPGLDQLKESFQRLVPQLARRLAREMKPHASSDFAAKEMKPHASSDLKAQETKSHARPDQTNARPAE